MRRGRRQMWERRRVTVVIDVDGSRASDDVDVRAVVVACDNVDG